MNNMFSFEGISHLSTGASPKRVYNTRALSIWQLLTRAYCVTTTHPRAIMKDHLIIVFTKKNRVTHFK